MFFITCTFGTKYPEILDTHFKKKSDVLKLTYIKHFSHTLSSLRRENYRVYRLNFINKKTPG